VAPAGRLDPDETVDVFFLRTRVTTTPPPLASSFLPLFFVVVVVYRITTGWKKRTPIIGGTRKIRAH